MKFNLKTFPRTAQGENRDEADIWAEGFEKELKEIDFKYMAGTLPKRLTVRGLIKEILGDA